MQQVYIDEKWVVDKYIMMEKTKSRDAWEAANDLRVLELERELLAESLGIKPESLPIIDREETVPLLDSDSD
jgi:hypothetical protein